MLDISHIQHFGHHGKAFCYLMLNRCDNSFIHSFKFQTFSCFLGNLSEQIRTKMLRFVLLTLACLCVAEGVTNFKQCKGKPAPLKVNVHDCEEPPCVVYKGQFALMDVQFVGNENNSRDLETKVTAKVFGITVPYDLPKEVSDICENLLYGAMCPIDKGEDVTYRFRFYVEQEFPEITTEVTVTLNDANMEPVACFIVSCKIRKGPASRNATDTLLLA